MSPNPNPITLPAPFHGRLCFSVDNVFTPDECSALIERTEGIGYEEALINGGGVQILDRDYRRSGRCIVDDPVLSAEIFSRIKHLLPPIFKREKLVRMNERLRFLRYDPGKFFQPHLDSYYQTPDGKMRTLLTMQLYLNEGFQGGETTFISGDGWERVPYVPKTGSVLVFEHPVLHKGSLLREGRKYTVRSDILYTKRYYTTD